MKCSFCRFSEPSKEIMHGWECKCYCDDRDNYCQLAINEMIEYNKIRRKRIDNDKERNN